VEYRHRGRTSAMSEGQRQNWKNKLVAAIAVGKPIAAWARENQMSRRTAYRWAKDPRVKAAVDARRRKALDHSVGVLTGRLTRAANCIADLGESAESESVRLSANKAVFSIPWRRSSNHIFIKESCDSADDAVRINLVPHSR